MKSKYSIQEYMKWLQVWATIECNLVFFTSKIFVPFIENIRMRLIEKTKIIVVEFEEFEAFKRYGKSFWIHELEKDHEKYHTIDLYAIWYEKKEFVKKAIELNPFFTNKFVWCDAGICRLEKWIPHVKSFPKAYKIPEDKFFVLQINDFLKEDNFQKINCVGGGILAASKKVWLSYYTKYDTMIEKYIVQNKFVGKDQIIIASMIKEEPDFFEMLGRNNLDDFLCWFNMLFYLS